MKKTFLLFALTLVISLFTACSDDSISISDNSQKGVARYTMILYGYFSGNGDFNFEGTMRNIQLSLKNKDDVRVLVVYKYGGGVNFSGELAYPGQLLFFELTKDTDLSKLMDKSAIVEDSVKLYDPDFISSVINYAHDSLPAQEYVFSIFSHGAGYDFLADLPKSERNKSKVLAKQTTVKAMVFDEWNPVGGYSAENLTMKELAKGIEKSKIQHFKALYFHNCLTGNMEELTEIYSYADYLLASEHSLYLLTGEMLASVVDALTEGGNEDFEEVIKTAFESNETKVVWKRHYIENGFNGDVQFIRTDKFADLNPIFKKLSKRLVELYADKSNRSAIDKAADKTYMMSPNNPLYDARDYAHKVAEKTKDKTLKSIAKELDEAFDAMFVTRALEAHYKEDAPLDHFSLSITLVDNVTYNEKMPYFNRTNRESYELTTFHKETGWGKWLNVNAHKPEGNPLGQLE